MKEENNCALSFQEKYFLNTFPLIRRIASRSQDVLNAGAVEDIFQAVALRLWRWKSKAEGRVLSEDEWRRYANTATRNEIKRFCGGKLRRREISWSEMESEIEEDYEMLSIADDFHQLIGNTEAETFSFLKYLWEAIGELSLRQKYALLFQRQDFIYELVSRRCSSLEEIAGSLEMSREEFITLAGRLPLSDEDIRELLETKCGDKITIKQVWMARGKAKAKLAAALKGLN